jgi:Transketolase, pyrimidine binding domain
MSGGQTSVPLTIRCAAGAGMQFGAQHSEMLEAWLTHVPGLKVVVPATPADAKGLLTAAGESGPGRMRHGGDVVPTVRVQPSGIEIEAALDEPVMSAARRAGYAWPTVCGGRVGWPTPPRRGQADSTRRPRYRPPAAEV